MAHRLPCDAVRPWNLTTVAGLAVAALAAACAPPAPVVLEAAPLTLPGRYRATQERPSVGLAAPWAQEAADVLGVDLPPLAKAVGVGSTQERSSATLVSPAHRTGDWTNTSSETARVYQLVPVRGGSPPRDWLAVLAAAGPPGAQVASASWRLGLSGRGGGPVATLALDAQIPHPREGLWDVLSTSLVVTEGKLQVIVEYSHAGSPDACEERFTFLVRVEDSARLVLERRAFDEEPCSQLGRPLEHHASS